MGIKQQQLPLDAKKRLAFITDTLELPLQPWQKKLLLMYWQDDVKQKNRKGVDLFEKY